MQDYRKRQTVCIQYKAGYFRNKLGFEVRQGFRQKPRSTRHKQENLDKIRSGIEECYSKILKNEGL